MDFKHHPHPHIEARKDQGPIKVRPIDTFNDKLGLRITNAVGTMWCAYAFAAIALTSLPSIIGTHSLPLLVAWVSQAFLQLVLLSIIIVGQNVGAKASDKRAEQTYDDAEAVLHEALEIQRHLLEQDKELTMLVEAAKHESTN